MDTLTLPCAVEIQAAAGDKAPTITGTAYGGGITATVLGLGNMAFDLRGVTIPDAPVPLLSEHGDAISAIVGQVTARIVGGQRIEFSGTLSRVTPAAQEVVPLAQEGYQFQCSVGLADAVFGQYVRPGESIVLNGRKLTAGAIGFRVVKTCTLREISLVTVGADLETAVSIAARAHFIQGVDSMDAKTETVVETPEQIQAKADVAETTRTATIRGMAAGFVQTNPARQQAVEAAADIAVKGGASMKDAEIAMLRASRPTWTPPQRSVNADSRSVLAAGWLILSGKASLAERSYGAVVCQMAADLRAHSMLDLCGAHLDADGQERPRGRMEMIRAAFSTLSMPGALGDALGKSVQEAYQETPATWTGFAAVKSTPDFRQQTGIRPALVGDMDLVAPGGELHHGSLAESLCYYKVDTFGKILGIDRTDVINDNAGALNDIGPAMGRMARRGVNDCAWSTVMANAGSFFDAANGNYISGADTALGIDGLTKAITAMRTQKNAQGNNLDIVPAVLCVPPELEAVGAQLLASTELARYVAAATDNQPTGNPWQGKLSLAVEPRLSNAKFTGYGAKKWYVFSAPSGAGLIVAFLDGQQNPTVEFFGLSAQVDVLGVQYRVYLDYGASLGDPKAAVLSKGEA